MTLCKHIPVSNFTIWMPRYHDKRVLLNKLKIRDHNIVRFTKAPSLGEEPYYISGKTARKFKTESNGVIDVLSVPLAELQPLEINNRCEHIG